METVVQAVVLPAVHSNEPHPAVGRLVLSVTTLLTLAYGARVEDAQDHRIDPGNLRAPPKALASNHRDPRTRPARTVSVVRYGIDRLRRLMLKGRLWPLPEPWPEPKPNLEITHHAPP